MKKYVAVAAGLILGSSAALAAKAAFEEVDVNSDGMITAEEAGVDISAADANGDGGLDAVEYEAMPE
jgi:hypothetical protein